MDVDAAASQCAQALCGLMVSGGLKANNSFRGFAISAALVEAHLAMNSPRELDAFIAMASAGLFWVRPPACSSPVCVAWGSQVLSLASVDIRGPWTHQRRRLGSEFHPPAAPPLQIIFSRWQLLPAPG